MRLASLAALGDAVSRNGDAGYGTSHADDRNHPVVRPQTGKGVDERRKHEPFQPTSGSGSEILVEHPEQNRGTSAGSVLPVRWPIV